VNQYQRELQNLDAKKCKMCDGTGKINDAEPGDIFYNIYVCSTCKGTGIFELEYGSST